MKIYEIDARIQELLDGSVNPENGEITFNIEELEALAIEREEKIESCACALKGYRTEKEGILKEVEALMKRVKSLEKQENNALNFIDYHLDGNPLKTSRVNISYRKSSKTEVDDEFVKWALENRPEFVRIKPAPDPEADRVKIGNAIKSGEEVPHARIVEYKNIKVS